jgi:hypothetical protein
LAAVEYIQRLDLEIETKRVKVMLAIALNRL